jgi:hypothetical protein
MQKDYLALVRGQWQSHTKVVQAPLLKNILQSGERIVRVSQEGKPSETRFKVEERYTHATLVAAVRLPGVRIRSAFTRSMRATRLPLTTVMATASLTNSWLAPA